MGIITTALLGLFLLSAPTASAVSPVQTALDNAPTYSVTMTGYNAVPAQTDADPTTTASGAYSNPQVVAARSRDLADVLPYGTVIAIEPTNASSTTCGADVVGDQIGFRVVADSMNARMHNKIDVLFGTNDTVVVGGKNTNAAVALGVCAVQVKVIGKINVKDMPKTQAELKKVVGEQLLAVSEK